MLKTETLYSSGNDILLIDDDPVIYESVKLMFPEYTIVYAKSGQEGCDLLQTTHAHISVVLLDYRMPKMDGLTVLENIKKINPEVRVIFISAMSSLILRQAMDRGAFAVIEKPIDYYDLQSLLWDVQQPSVACS